MYNFKKILLKNENTLTNNLTIDEIFKSNIIVNALNQIGIKNCMHLMYSNVSDILSNIRCNETNKREIVETKFQVNLEYKINTDEKTAVLIKTFEDVLKEWEEYGLCDTFSIRKRLIDKMEHYLNNFDDNNDTVFEYYSCIETLYNDFDFYESLGNILINVIESEDDKIGIEIIRNKLPNHIKKLPIIQDTLNELDSNGCITITPDGCEINYIYLMELIENTEAEDILKDKGIFIRRLNGQTLESIANVFELTLERIRQIILTATKNLEPLRSVCFRLYEDKYSHLFRKYNFDKESFTLSLNEPQSTYNYLEVLYNKGTLDLKEIFSDRYVTSNKIIKGVESYIYKDYFDIDGVRFKKSRTEISHYTVKTYCRQTVNFDYFLEKYEYVLKKLQIEDTSPYKITAKTYESRLSNEKFLLWKYNHKLRYYDITSRNYDELYEKIGLENYHDIEYSTLKFFKEYPSLMRKYDIQDEYELHSLLKKTINKKDYPDVRFSKMPKIIFGTPNRDKLVKELLFKNAPISSEEFITLISDQYGVRKENVVTYWLEGIKIYLKDGVYDVIHKVMSDEQLEELKRILTKDFYFIQDLHDIYISNTKNPDVALLTPYNLKKIGFIVNNGYAFKDIYDFADDYFRVVLSQKDVFTLNDLGKEFTTINAFNATLSNMRTNYELIEYAHHSYINIRVLNNKGIGIEDLKDYCESVCNFVEENEFFTIKSIKSNGFTHKLDELEYSDCFYASLLRAEHNRISYKKMDNSTLFYKGNISVSRTALVEKIVNEQEKINIFTLIEYIDDKFGLKFDKWEIYYLVKNTNLVYDNKNDMIYKAGDISHV